MALGSHNSSNINRIWQYFVWKVTYRRVIKKKVVILVYSVKSYCVLKMSENKEEIWYILKFYYKKGKNATQAAKKICDIYRYSIMIQYQYLWNKTGFKRLEFSISSIFSLEILMSEMHFVVHQSTGKNWWNHGKSYARHILDRQSWYR